MHSDVGVGPPGCPDHDPPHLAGDEGLRRFVADAPAALAMFDTDMRYLAASERWRQDYALPQTPLLGLSHYDVFPEIPESWKDVHRRCLANAVEYQDEDLFVRADGRRQWVRWEVRPWLTVGGAVGGLVIFSEDITLRKNAEQALHHVSQQFRLALDASRAGTWQWDARSNEGTWDDRFHAQYGFAPGAPRTFDAWIARLHADDRPRVLAQLDGIRTHGHDEWDVEFRSVLDDGRVVWHYERGHAERDAGGQLLGLAGIDLDVTASKAPTGRAERDTTLSDERETARGLLAAVTHGVLSMDPRGTIVAANAAIETMFGWNAGELVGRSIEVLVPSSVRDAHVRHRTAYADAPSPRPMGVGLDLEGQRKDGSTFPVEVSLNHIAAPGGGYTLAFVTDITPRKRAAQAERDLARLAALRAEIGAVLAKSLPLREVLQEAAAALVSHLGVAFLRIWTLDSSTALLTLQASAGLYTHLDGRHARVAVGQLKIGRIAARGLPHVTNDVLHDAEIGDVEWARREGMVAFAGHPLIVEGRVVGVMATFARTPLEPTAIQDLAVVADAVAQCIERKHAEATLRANEQRLQLIVDHARLGLWDWDVVTGRTVLDDRWWAILGYTPGDLPTEFDAWRDSIHPDDSHDVLAALQHHLANSSSLYDVEYRARTKRGEWIWLNTRGRVYERAADGQPLRMMGTIHDISARKRAESERLAFDAQLQQAQKLESLGVLAGGVAHDFNNLLMVILGHSTLASDEVSEASPVAASLHAIQQAATRGAELTQQMLAYAGRSPVLMRAMRVDQLVQEQRTLFDTAISKKAVVDLQLEPAAIDGDASQIRQVVLNLITNASEALGDDAGAIHVRTYVRSFSADELRSPHLQETPPDGRYAVIEVTDTGRGMDADVLARMFDPFFSTKFTGRGLGLAAVLGIVRRHHGTIAVASTVGRGTTFRVFLPLAATPPVASDSGLPVEAPRHGTILVVDDESGVRGVVSNALERAGFRVLTAADGREGLALFGRHRQDIQAVLLDLTMPHLDGSQVLQEIRRQAPEVPVLVMSGYSPLEVSSRLEGLGAAALVQKPISMRDLVGRLRGILRVGSGSTEARPATSDGTA